MTASSGPQPPPALGETAARHERRTWIVAALAAAAAGMELTGGWWAGSAAVLAEGLHMGAHVTAFVLAGLGYKLARRLAASGRGASARAVPDLAALANGLLLLGLGTALGLESLDALRRPAPVAYATAMSVAVFGLIVNVGAAVLLHHDHTHEPGHGRDLNFTAIHLHVMGDGAVAALAIAGLLLGRATGWRWTDGATGMIGALLVVILGAQVAVRSLRHLGGRRLDPETTAELKTLHIPQP